MNVQAHIHLHSFLELMGERQFGKPLWQRAAALEAGQAVGSHYSKGIWKEAHTVNCSKKNKTAFFQHGLLRVNLQSKSSNTWSMILISRYICSLYKIAE